ncbi:MAG: hypothetical protein M1812_004697 [Candelaria pacifica]|nr:MAG: hypothetical protein M1812_004697 [Candelaria pacifica]
MEPRYRRPSSPGSRRLANPMRSSTGSVGYSSPYEPYYAGPRSSLRDVAPPSRSGVQPIGGVERISADPGRPVPRTIQKDIPTTSHARGDSTTQYRRATLDRDSEGGRRPANLMPPPSNSSRTRPIIHTSTLPNADRPSSPLARTRQSTEDEDYYVQPASSGRRGQHRRIYSLDSNDIDRGVRERDNQVAQVPSDGTERGGYRSSGLGGGRRGYNLKGPLVRRADPESDDYGYSYTNPKEQMYRDTAPRPRPRRDSYSTQTRERPLSMTGMEDYLPRVPNRDAGPPPTTRQLDRLGGVGRSSSLRQSPRPPVDNRSRNYPPSGDTNTYDASPSRRPVTKPISIHHKHDYGHGSDSEDYDEPDRRDKRERRARRADDEVSTRGFGVRAPDIEHDRAVDRYDTRYKEPRFTEAPPKLINNELPHRVDRGERAPQGRAPRDREYSAEDLRNQERRSRTTRDADVFGQGLGEEELRDIELRDLRKREIQELKDSYRGPRKDEYPEPDRRRKEHRPKEYSDEDFETDEEDRRDRERRRRLRRERKARERDALNTDPRNVDPREPSFQEPDYEDTKDYVEEEPRHRDQHDRESDREQHREPHDRGSQGRDHGHREPRKEESYEKLLDDGEPLVGEPDAVTPDRPTRVRVVSPSGAREPEQPVKGILRPPREKFPEDPAPIREGVAPLKDAGKKGIPPGARWTKVDRKLVNPAALEEAQERFEERLDYVIVLRVLTKDEIQGFAARTQEIRDERYALEKRERHRRRDEPRAIEDSQPALMAIEAPADPRRPTIVEPSSNRANAVTTDENFRENPDAPGTYMGYRRNPPPPRSPQQ